MSMWHQTIKQHQTKATKRSGTPALGTVSYDTQPTGPANLRGTGKKQTQPPLVSERKLMELSSMIPVPLASYFA